MPFPRTAGILLHPTSLPGAGPIGDLGDGAIRFLDFLAAAGQGIWQVLPLGPPGGSHSPYQSLSSFAGNPLLISLDALARDEASLVPQQTTEADGSARADHERARAVKTRALRTAHGNYATGHGSKSFRAGFEAFREAEAAWLDGFALFMALKTHFDGAAWHAWPDKDLVRRAPAALARAAKELAREVEYHAFCQYVFFSQWRRLRAYANQRGIRILGDIPIYVAHDSADVWTQPQLFALARNGRATHVAGVPPDYFSATGQLWGNPLYLWARMAQDGYAWWIDRIRATLAMVDMLRIDHFRGFESYWEIPGDAETAVNGRWVPGPGAAFFEAIGQALGDLPIVAEDLGIITPAVDALRRRFALPGMKVLQFAFCEGAEVYLPHTYEPNCVVYTATHDNDTTVGWYRAEGPDYAHMDPDGIRRERDKARRYLARDGSTIHLDLVRLALRSVACMAVVPMQDILGLDNCARMNRPGIADGQWAWRLTSAQLAAAPADLLREMVWLYGRERAPIAADP